MFYIHITFGLFTGLVHDGLGDSLQCTDNLKRAITLAE